MRTLIDDRLRREAKRFALRFACEDCAHFDDAAARCSLAYPTLLERQAIEACDAPHLETCKEFDLV